MGKTDVALDLYARNLHRAHERRAGSVTTHWKFLDPQDREEYMAVARNIHAALYLTDRDVTATAAHLVSHYNHGDRPGSQRYWESRVREALGHE